MIPPDVAGPEVSEPVAVFAVFLFVAFVSVADPEVSDPVAVLAAFLFVALVSVADVAEPQVSFDIALAFDVLVPVSAVAV